jgi:ribose transport system permease protein
VSSVGQQEAVSVSAGAQAEAGPDLPSRLRSRIHDPDTQRTAISLAALLILCAWATYESSVFLSISNFRNILQQISYVVIILCPFTLLIISGEFDLSVGAVGALTGTLAAHLAQNGMNVYWAFVIACLIGAVVGVLNGFMVLCLGINSFIATIGMMYMCYGAANLVSGGVNISGLPTSYPKLGNTTVDGTPITVIIMLVTIVLFAVIQRSTLLGRYATASGSNATASFLVGVPVRRTRWALFIVTAAFAGFAGIIVSSQFDAGLPNVSLNLQFEIIVAAVVGGVSLFGGEGSILGACLGALIIGVLNNALDLAGVQSFWQEIALGLMLVLAVGIDVALRGGAMRARVKQLRNARDIGWGRRGRASPSGRGPGER